MPTKETEHTSHVSLALQNRVIRGVNLSQLLSEFIYFPEVSGMSEVQGSFRLPVLPRCCGLESALPFGHRGNMNSAAVSPHCACQQRAARLRVAREKSAEIQRAKSDSPRRLYPAGSSSELRGGDAGVRPGESPSPAAATLSSCARRRVPAQPR